MSKIDLKFRPDIETIVFKHGGDSVMGLDELLEQCRNIKRPVFGYSINAYLKHFSESRLNG